MWQLNALQKSIPLLTAEESIQKAHAVRVGWADKKSYKRQINKWKRQAKPYSEPEIAVIAPKHKAWFEQNNIPHIVNEDIEA